MNPLLYVILEKGLLFDSFGIIGLGLIGLAAVKLARTYGSWGGTLMASGAISLLVARLYFTLSPHFLNDDFRLAIGQVGNILIEGLPTILLTFGFAAIVGGLWGHERWMNEETR